MENYELYRFPITEHIAKCWRLKCFNSDVIESSGQIPDRTDCIAFFTLLIRPSTYKKCLSKWCNV